MYQGWIKIHRKLQDNDLYFSEPFTKIQAWIDLLILANHKETIIYIRGNEIKIKTGFVGWSEVNLAKRWRWSREKLRRFLCALETRQQIVRHKSKVLSLIEIVNYKQYQSNETTDETTDKTTDETTDETLTRMIKNDKNILSNKLDNGSNDQTKNSKEVFLLPEKKDSTKPRVPDEQKNSSKVNRKDAVDAMVMFLKNLLRQKKIADFKNDNKTIRGRTWNIIQMATRQEDPIPKEELQRRLNILFSNPCQNLNCWQEKNIHHCNDINKLYAALKGFVEPQTEKQLNQY